MTKLTLFADLVALLGEDLREYYEERAGIREYDGGQCRQHAECLALLDTLRRDRWALCGVVAWRVEIDGSPQCLLLGDGHTPTQLGRLGATVLGRTCINAELARLGGAATLTRLP